jgi:abortive infection bacteriophage resistance protein
MPFGQLSMWFNNLKHRTDRIAIAGIYGIDEAILGLFMHHLTHIRNLSAHHSRLWNRRIVFTMRIPSLPVDLSRMFNPKADRNIYNTLVMLKHPLKLISPGMSWLFRMGQLIEEYVKNKTIYMAFRKISCLGLQIRKL